MAILFAILIVGLAATAEDGFRFDPERDFGLRGWPAATVAIGSVALVLLWQWGVTALAGRRLRQARGIIYLDIADITLAAAQWAIIAGYAAALFVFGWGATVQVWLGGDVILVDLVITILPPVIGLAGTWFVYEPIVSRLREARMIRSIDEGRIVHAPPSRLLYTFLQLRINLLFLLAPLLAIVLLRDVIDHVVPIENGADDLSIWLNEGLTAASAIGVFITAPFFARLILSLHHLPQGEVRDDLLSVCRDHKIRVRDVLIWDTHSAMINAAVMGLFGWVRYVMITDGLLESLRRPEVIAVMAHEVGHVRRWHMPWILVCVFAAIMVPAMIAYAAALAFDSRVLAEASTFIAIGAAIPAFGWISRRFERQADTFAVQHLSGLRSGSPDRGEVVTPEAAATMTAALESVARLNGMNPRRKSWRHGSIRWRQDYLRSIVGRPLRSLGIDREIRLIKVAALTLLVGSLAAGIWLDEVARERAGRSGPDGGRHRAAIDDANAERFDAGWLVLSAYDQRAR